MRERGNAKPLSALLYVSLACVAGSVSRCNRHRDREHSGMGIGSRCKKEKREMRIRKSRGALNRYPNNFLAIALSYHLATAKKKRGGSGEPFFMCVHGPCALICTGTIHERKSRRRGPTGMPYLRIIMIKYFFGHKYMSETRDPRRAQATRRTLQRDKRTGACTCTLHTHSPVL